MPESNEDDLETRLSTVEQEVARLREETVFARNDAAAARVLAAGADRDVAEVRSELRAHTQALNALRETQLDHHGEMRRFQTEMMQFQAETAENFAKVDQNFTKVEGSMAQVKTGLAHITTLIEGIADSR